MKDNAVAPGGGAVVTRGDTHWMNSYDVIAKAKEAGGGHQRLARSKGAYRSSDRANAPRSYGAFFFHP